MLIKWQCDCGKNLKVSTEHAGKRLKCPSCEKPLTVPQAPRRPKPKPEEEEYVVTEVAEEAPRKKAGKRPAKKKKPEPKKSNAALILGLCIGGVVLLGGGGAAVWFLTSDDDPVVADVGGNGGVSNPGVTTSGTPRKQQAQPSDVKLTNGKASLVMVVPPGDKLYAGFATRAEVEYEFVGTPIPDAWYWFNTDGGATLSDSVQGKDLAPKGKLARDSLKFRPRPFPLRAGQELTVRPWQTPPPSTIKIRVMQGTGKGGPFRPIAELEVPLESQTTYKYPDDAKVPLGASPEGSSPPTTPSFTLSSDEFAKEFRADPSAAKVKYRNALVEIKGPVASISAYNSSISLGREYDLDSRVYCRTAIKKPWSKVLMGQTVTLRGRIDLERTVPHLKECEIVKVEGEKPEKLTPDEFAERAKEWQEYIGQPVTVTGTVASVKASKVNEVIVYFQTSPGKHKMRCVLQSLLPAQKPLVKQGATLTLHGSFGATNKDSAEALLANALLLD